MASRVGASVRRTCRRSCRSAEMRRLICVGGQLLDPVLELVDLIVDRIHEVEEVFGDLVDEAVDDQPDALLLFFLCDCVVHVLRVERVPCSGVFRTVTSRSRVAIRSISW